MTKIITLLSFLCLFTGQLSAQTIRNGIPWTDNRDSVMSAHGANIVLDNGRYYLFGEYKTDSANVFTGVSCYSSADLEHWRWEGIALAQQRDGRLGPGRVGERPKVMRCPSTGEYVMIIHSDNLRYKAPCVAYATSKTITGPYRFQGPLLFEGKPIRKWDLGSFVDHDGTGYLLLHHGTIYRLSQNYHYAVERVVDGVKGVGESPTMFRKNGIYYWISSNTTSWERNDNKYFTATDLHGPWTFQGLFCPKGSLTWNSQSSFVLPIVNGQDTIAMYMGDRWSFPKQRSAATYVWLPLQTEGTRLSIPEYLESWDVLASTSSHTVVPDFPTTTVSEKPALGRPLRLKLHKNQRIAIFGKTHDHGCYADIEIRKGKKQVIRQTIDLYSSAPAEGLRYLSPALKKGKYTLIITASPMRPNWTDKSRTIYGSKGNAVDLTRIAITR
ncbi:MAG: family 43 glycosylhydrolase [Prevotella sp.]|nr:family 43 glycosylhydrolase [Prevotella sp.]